MGQGVQPEAIDPHVEVMPSDFVITFPKFGVAPVHVRHLFGEDMEVEFIGLPDSLPCAGGKKSLPIVRGKEFSALVSAFANVVISAFLARRILYRFLEPGVLVARVVHDEIEAHADPSGVGFAEQGPEVLVGPIEGIDRIIIGHIVSVIVHRGSENRANPKEVHPEFAEVVEPRNDPREVSDAVAVAVLKSLWIKNISDAIAPPICLFHAIIISLFFGKRCEKFDSF